MRKTISAIVHSVEEMIEEGFPYTLPLAIMWMCVGWPLYLLGAVLKKVDEWAE